jgi:hypothetical protein
MALDSASGFSGGFGEGSRGLLAFLQGGKNRVRSINIGGLRAGQRPLHFAIASYIDDLPRPPHSHSDGQ